MSSFTVTWHSGAENTPDNSLEFVKKALENNAEIFEIDLSFLPDGTPVIIHDGAPEDTSLPTLESVFELMSRYENTKINLDVKSVKNIAAVDPLAKKYGLTGRCFFTGVEEGWIDAVRAQSELPYYLNCSVPLIMKRSKASLRRFAEKVKKLGALGINCHYSSASALVVNTMRENGVETSFWTVNKPADRKRIAALEPDNITSREPLSFR